MFHFRLCASDREADWRSTPTGVASGSSFIDPLRLEALEEVIACDGARLLVCVRERCAGIANLDSIAAPGAALSTRLTRDAFDSLVERLRSWPLQWHMLVADGASATLEAGLWGTAPVFLLAAADRLHGDWDAGRLLPHLRPANLDLAGAANWLADFATPYGHTTLFRGLRLLTERSTASWRRGPDGSHALTMTYPPSWLRPIAGTLHANADPLDGFDKILDAALHRWTGIAGDTLGCELSGGLDSALVAATMRRRSKAPLRSYGLAITGQADAVADQAARRADLVATFGLQDTEIPMMGFLPLAPGSCRLDGRAPVLPWEEGYYEAVDALLERAYASGTRVMATGFGGDELFGLRPSEIEPLQAETRPASIPPSTLPLFPPCGPSFLTAAAREVLSQPLDLPPCAASSASSVEVAALGAAQYLRRGIWPIHPLCTPELVRFCARLPAAWRAGRAIERALLARNGVPQRVTQPLFCDDLSPALTLGMRGPARPLVERLFANSILADLGVVDGGRMRRDYTDWCEKNGEARPEPFYAAAALELCLARMQ